MNPLNKATKRQIGNPEFRREWKRIVGDQRDSWGVEYMYNFMGWRLWKAAIRAQKRATSAGEKS